MNLRAIKAKNFLKVTLALYCVFSVAACSIFAPAQKPPDKKPQVFKISFRQLPPEPVYNRIRVAHLPDVKPSQTIAASNAPYFDPMVKLSLKNSTLEQAAIALSSLGNYQFYAASSIAKQKVSIEAYGTLEQVAQQVALRSGSHVVVDHPNKQIRILKQASNVDGVEPSFAGSIEVKGVNGDK